MYSFNTRELSSTKKRDEQKTFLFSTWKSTYQNCEIIVIHASESYIYSSNEEDIIRISRYPFIIML